MLKNLLGSIFGTRNDRLISNYKKLVTKINAFEEKVKKLKDAEEREIQFTVPRVSKDIKRKPARTYTASHSRRSEASDFLNS